MKRRIVHKKSQLLLPWEHKKSRRPWRKNRIGVLVCLASMLAALGIFVSRREEQAAAVRSTRSVLETSHEAVVNYRADHAGRCPASLAEVVHDGYMTFLPFDAWGKPLQLVCPADRLYGFALSSQALKSQSL